MLTKTKAVLAAVLMLGTASAALANDSGENNQGGYVVPGSMDGVNPVFHPGWFPNYPRTGNADQAYGFVAPAKQTHRPVHQPTPSTQD